MKEKNYSVNIDIKFCNVVSATSKKEAIIIAKESIVSEYGLCPTNKEITSVEVVE